jgi:hypothetical protein
MGFALFTAHVEPGISATTFAPSGELDMVRSVFELTGEECLLDNEDAVSEPDP